MKEVTLNALFRLSIKHADAVDYALLRVNPVWS